MDEAATKQQAELRAVLDFLYGAAPLDGVWFGNGPPPGKPRYWWRSRLRDAVRAIESQPSAPRAEAVEAKDAQRYRWLRDATGETPLRPAAYGSEYAPDMRLRFDFPTLVSFDAIGQQLTLDAAIDAAIAQGADEGERNHA